MRRLCGDCKRWKGGKRVYTGLDVPVQLGTCSCDGETRERCDWCPLPDKQPRPEEIPEDWMDIDQFRQFMRVKTHNWARMLMRDNGGKHINGAWYISPENAENARLRRDVSKKVGQSKGGTISHARMFARLHSKDK